PEELSWIQIYHELYRFICMAPKDSPRGGIGKNDPCLPGYGRFLSGFDQEKEVVSPDKQGNS
ncbi:MAG TPA: hypothetical protein PK445_01600, partial [Methanolinea sp.]|nr:hypothetical protein [Methanolinea sp.]HPC54726.1 hypothetical protein [Methanolinea sp.]